MYKTLLIFIGGGLGSTLRYILGTVAKDYWGITYPYGTFIINIIGCFFIGLILALGLGKSDINQELKIFLTIGFAGGFTTFSTFGHESATLISHGQTIQSMTYIALSITGGIGAIYAGEFLAKYI